MFKKNYKFVMMADQTEEVFNAMCKIFNTFGEIEKITKAPLCETKNPENEICDMLIFDLRMKTWKFNKMIKGFEEQGYNPKLIRGHWFM